MTAAPARGAFLALGAWTKFAALVLVPLWAGYPLALGRRGLRSVGLFAAGFAAATRRVLDPVPRAEPAQRRRDVLGPHLRLAARPSVAVLDLGLDEYPGFPDLHVLQGALKVALLVGALALGFLPRVRTPSSSRRSPAPS